MLTWWEWIPLFIGAIAGTFLAIGFYWHWTYRYRLARLGAAVEIALGVVLACAGWWATASLLVHRP